jgi:hypothetical protein
MDPIEWIKTDRRFVNRNQMVGPAFQPVAELLVKNNPEY